MALVHRWPRKELGRPPPDGNSLGGNLPPSPGNGTQHDGKGTGCQGGEEAEVQRPLHAIVAHAHHRVQVVLKGSNTKYSTMSNGRSLNLLPRADERGIIHEEKRSRECRGAGTSLYSTLVGKQLRKVDGCLPSLLPVSLLC